MGKDMKVDDEIRVVEIGLRGAASERNMEISGMAWCGDRLVLLPQYPSTVLLEPDREPKLYTLMKKEILDYLDAVKKDVKTSPLEPRPIALNIEASLLTKIKGIRNYEGFEAIVFWGDSVYISLEASPGPMEGYLVKGTVNRKKDGKGTGAIAGITLHDRQPLVKLEAQAKIGNACYETLLVTKERIFAFYEGNGRNINKNPAALVFDHDLKAVGKVTFPNIEYRLTDATEIDGANRFWCANYQWAGDIIKYNPAPDPLFKAYGKGKTHQLSPAVERLVEFQYVESKNRCHFIIADRPPLQLQLPGTSINDGRNWEGIVRLENRGFLTVTDKHPRTILAFIPYK